MRTLRALLLASWALCVASIATARPPYFDTFTTLYGFTSGDNLYACGTCHYLWTGTGARNPYGSAVEQQLYLGKSIINSLLSVEGFDSDFDGFTNGDEIVNFETLPGYSCDTFTDAIGAPANYHTFVTPMVPSCLEPIDIRVSTEQISLLAAVDGSSSAALEIFNNGTDAAIDVSFLDFLDGTDPALSLDGPTAPFSIPVGGSVVVNVDFTPTSAGVFADTIRISSNDPDESDIDVTVSAVSLPLSLAQPEQRAACLGDVQRRYRSYSRRQLKEWSSCFLAELSGRACDTGLLNLRLAKDEQRLRRYIGGDRDRFCAAQNLTPTNLGLPATCGGSCSDITVSNLTRYVDCLVCRQSEAVASLLGASTGTEPPDLPANPLAGAPLRCQKQALRAARSGVARLQRNLGACEEANITAVAPVDCAAQLAGEIARVQERVNARIERCDDTTDLLGCFDSGASPTCLGDATLQVGDDLVDATFGLE